MMDYGRTLIKKSLLIISSIMGLIFAAAMIIAWKLNINLACALLISLFVVLFQFAISPVIIGMLYSIQFGSAKEHLSIEVISFLENKCMEVNIPVPRLGIIKDGNPNAFTFGHIPRNARLVLTTGLIDVLTEDEQKAVIAHELGHIKHYDFILMTLVSLIPLVLYQVYMWTKAKDKSKPEYWVGIGSYIVYILSQFVVLSFSRVREYYADSFSKKLVKNGEDLKNALIKISYGLTSIEKRKTPKVSALAFTNNLQNEALLLGNYKMADRTEIQEKLLKWDMINLWAK
jgi:heat shock protein HtpX